jgi:polysaccharide export outer membrane protein
MIRNQGKSLPTKGSVLSVRATLFAVLLSTLAASCRLEKPPGYFEQGIDTAVVDVSVRPELPIQPGDLLSILFYSDNPEATAIYNQVSGVYARSPAASAQENIRQSASGGGAAQAPAGYRVDADGNIRIHGLGSVKAQGLTRAELERRLTERITAMGVLTNAYCVVQFSGIRITVLGEVRAPGAFQTANERMTVFDAIGMAGDILPSGRKQDVLVIRDEDGRRSYAKVDLTSQDVFRSPHLHLRQNDLVVVQANRLQLAASDTQRQQYMSLAVSAASILILLLNLILN